MTHFDRILVPVDFSDQCAVAVRQAGAVARHFHSQVTLFHVSDFALIHPLTGPLGFGVTSPDPLRAEYLAARRQALNEFGKANLEGVNVRRIVCCGDPAQLIVERACAEQTDLILMPTHGHGAFRRFLLGSVTAKVLHDAECPVWTGTHLAGAAPADLSEVRHVMCAVNFGPQSTKALRWAADLASELDAELTVVHAVQETPANLPERYMFQWHEEADWGAKEQMRIMLLDTGIKAGVMVASNADVTQGICSAAQQQGAGLLVIGRSGAADRKLGEHTYSIICHAPCPVVSV